MTIRWIPPFQRLFLTFSCTGLLLLSGCTKDNTPPPTPLLPLQTQSISIHTQWSHRVTSGTENQNLRLGSALEGDRIVTAGYDGRIAALNAQTGHTLWTRVLPDPVSATPGVNHNQVFIGTMDGTLYALNLHTGAILWHTAMPNLILGAPAATDDLVVVQCHDSSVEAYAADTGKQLWSYDETSPRLTLYGNSSPLLSDGMAYVGFDNGQLGAFDLYQGIETWQIPVAIPSSPEPVKDLVDLDGTPILDGNTLFATSYNGNVTAIETTSGKLIWQKPLSSYETLALAEDKLFVTDDTGKVLALDESTGNTIWANSTLRYRFVTAPTVWNQWVAVGDYAGYMHFLSMEEGQTLGRIHVSSEGINTPALIYHNELIVTDEGGQVTALSSTP